MPKRTLVNLAVAALLMGCQDAGVPPVTAEAGLASALPASSPPDPTPAPSTPPVPAPPADLPSPRGTPSIAPSPSAIPSPSVTPRATAVAASASAPAPPAGLKRVAVTRHDGIRVRIELQHNPLVAGEPSWVRVTVANTGKDVVTWFHDGCALAAWVHGESQVAWAEGQQLSAQARMFKQYALGAYNGQPVPPAAIRYVPREMLGAGSYGCADIGMSDRIKPGAKLRQTLWWSGYADVNRTLPPNGPMSIKATAAYYWRGTREPDDIPEQALDLHIDVWVVGGTGGTGGDRLSPAQVVDAAVADAGFAAYLETQELASGREAIAWYDAEAGVWEVGVMPWYETQPPRIHGVLVDPVTGAVLGKLDRPWDEEADGFP